MGEAGPAGGGGGGEGVARGGGALSARTLGVPAGPHGPQRLDTRLALGCRPQTHCREVAWPPGASPWRGQGCGRFWSTWNGPERASTFSQGARGDGELRTWWSGGIPDVPPAAADAPRPTCGGFQGRLQGSSGVTEAWNPGALWSPGQGLRPPARGPRPEEVQRPASHRPAPVFLL